MRDIETHHCRWYIAICMGDEENEYEMFPNDETAIRGFLDQDIHVLEIYECCNDECLTPMRLVWH